MAASAVATDRTHHRGELSPPCPEPHRPPIEGGTLSTTPLALLAAWAAYLLRLIDLRTYRVWWALVEVHARHEIVKRRGAHPCHFTVEHVIKALGVSAPMRRVDVEVALERLAELGLVVMTKRKLVFVDDVAGILLPELRHEVFDLIEDFEVGQWLDQPMSIPRRMISAWRQQARGSRVGMGVQLGLLLRIAFMSRYGDYRGCVKGPWLEAFSGGSRSAVKLWLQRLERDRLFERLPTPQRVLQQHGQWWRLNPAVPDEPHSPTREPTRADFCGKVVEIGPPPCGQQTEIGPPLNNQVSPFGRSRNQIHGETPATFGASPHHLIEKRRLTPDVNRLPVPWRDIQHPHLENPLSLRDIYHQVVDRGYVTAGKAGLLTVFTQTQRVLRGTRKPGKDRIRNPGAALRWSLEHLEAPRCGSDADEDKARALMAELDALPQGGAGQAVPAPDESPAAVGTALGAPDNNGWDGEAPAMEGYHPWDDDPVLLAYQRGLLLSLWARERNVALVGVEVVVDVAAMEGG